MCGFAAYFEHERIFSNALISATDQDLFHRGPDSGGQYVSPGMAIIFRRLAIIDPDGRSDQPFIDKTGRYVLVFNGEIYNFKEIRQQLMADGVSLRTDGDAEVILEGYIHWGEKILSKLEGMFAFVITDTKEGRVIAARDPYGIKPLYMARTGKQIGFASEARPLRRLTGRTEVDTDALAELLMFRFAAGRMSNLKGIDLLPGGSVVHFSIQDGNYREHRYCDPLDTIRPDNSITRDRAIELIEDGVTKSLEAHLQSDVGYSIQLSGGVDSSLVLALATEKSGLKLDSYAVRLSEKAHDESPFRAQVVARYKPNHTELDLDAHAFADALPKAIHHMEGPTAHFGCVMLMLLCQTISQKHKVVLTGEGADEFFGGYDRYSVWRDLRLKGTVGKLIPKAFWPLLKRYEYLRRFEKYDSAIVASVYFNFLTLQNIFPDLIAIPGDRTEIASRFTDFRDRMLAVDQTSYLGSLLMRQDKMAMASGVEARVPFTHYPLAAKLNRIPRELRIPGGETKPLLKEIARRYLPKEIVDRRKVGLTLPLEGWLRDPNGLGRYLDLLTEPSSRLGQYANKGALVKIVEDFRASNATPGLPPLAHLVNLELWLRSLEEI